MHSMENLKRLGKLSKAENDAWNKFQDFNQSVMSEGNLPAKTKELIALAVALTTQCSYCLEIHREAAKKAGVTEEEIAETILVAGALRAGAAITHGSHLLA